MKDDAGRSWREARTDDICLDNYRLYGYHSSMETVATSTKPRFDCPEQEAYLNLWRTYDRLRAIEDEVFARFELTAQQYNALRLLDAAAPDPMATLAIAERLISRAPDITRLLDKLEQRGLVCRTRDQNDRRSVLVSITAAGTRLLEDLSEPIRESHERQLGHLTPTDLKRLTALLRAAREPHEPSHRPWQ